MESFANFILHLINTEPPFNNNAAGVRASLRIENALEDPGAVLELEHADWRTLRAAAQRPGGTMTPPVLYPFVVALDEARDSVFEVRLPGHWVNSQYRGQTVKMRTLDVPKFWFELLKLFEERGIDPVDVPAPPDKPTVWDHILLGTILPE